MNTADEADVEGARALADKVTELIEQFKADGGQVEATIDHLTLTRTKLLEFADDPSDPLLRAEVRVRVEEFLGLTGQAQHGVV